jgi:flagellar biosynthesis chaperone FliJ
MKKFEFPLQAVLTLREMKEEQALEIYAKSVQECATKKEDLIKAMRRTDYLENLLQQKTGEKFSASMRYAYLLSMNSSREEVARRTKLYDDAEKLKAKRLEEFLDRRHKKEIIEKLKSRQKENHLAEGRRMEEIEIEDLTISRHGQAKMAI